MPNFNFIDHAKVKLISGNGGDGLVSFASDPKNYKAGPDGGNGGNGGDIFIMSDPNINNLLSFRHHLIFKAEHGNDGKTNNKHGANGEATIIKVPVGTIIFDEQKKVLFDFIHPNQQFLILHGGEGGKGNTFFQSNQFKTPKIASRGLLGRQITILLELKLIADAALIGMPNVGKSTLLAALTNALPKIANYPFTTLSPQLGILKTKNIPSKNPIIIVDIPGLIEDAHIGKGLGDKFLNSIARCDILIFCLDCAKNDLLVIEQYNLLVQELNHYDPSLIKKHQIIVVNKIDLLSPSELKQYQQDLNNLSSKLIFISALKLENLTELNNEIIFQHQKLNEVKKSLPIVIDINNYLAFKTIKNDYRQLKLTIIKKSVNQYELTDLEVKNLFQQFPPTNLQNKNYLMHLFAKYGWTKQLLKNNVIESDFLIVDVYKLIFAELIDLKPKQ